MRQSWKFLVCFAQHFHLQCILYSVGWSLWETPGASKLSAFASKPLFPSGYRPVSTNDAFGRSPVLKHRAQLEKRFEVRHHICSCRLALARHRELRGFGLLLQVQLSGPTTASQFSGQCVLWFVLHCLMHLLSPDLRLLHRSRIEKCGRKSTRRPLLNYEGKRYIFWHSDSRQP